MFATGGVIGCVKQTRWAAPAGSVLHSYCLYGLNGLKVERGWLTPSCFFLYNASNYKRLFGSLENERVLFMATSHPSASDSARSRPRLSRGWLGKFVILGLALVLAACAGINSAGRASRSATPAVTPTFASTSGNQLVTVVHEAPLPGAGKGNVTEGEFAIIPSINT